jgi:hypothetical protein
VPRFDPPSSVFEPGTVVRMSAPTGTILYTLDGSDPRIPGGAVSPSALEFGSSATATLLSPESHSGVRALVPTGGQLGTTWTQPGFDDRGWRLATGGIGVGYERGFGYELSIDLDVEVEMFERATSVYARMEFEVEAPELYRFLYLDLQYDDGFVAYLNGRRVASNNAPAAPSWNSQSTAQNPDEAALSFETFDISAHAGELRAGRNVLALHGFNTNTTSSDLLIRPRLRASGAFTGDALPLDGYAAIRARTRIGDDWSALGEATYLSDDGRDVRVSELHYHPRRPAPPSQVSEEDFEFLEIENIGPAAVDLRGLRLTRGIDFDFAESDVVFLAPGARAVVVSDLDAFRSRYGAGGIAVAGEYSGQLANGGERVRLENALGESLIDFDYDDGWYPETDGGGHSLVVVDTAGDPERLSEKPSWRPSAAPDGTPGAAEDGSGEGGGQVPGDANQDGFLDIADAISLLSHLFGDRNQPTPCGGSLLEGSNRVLVDYNGDGGIDLTDAIGLLRFLHLGGQPHHRGTGCIALPGCASVCD